MFKESPIKEQQIAPKQQENENEFEETSSI